MQSRSLFGHKQVWSSVLKTTFLSLLVVASACARIPNTIPYGYDKVFKGDPARAASAARVDYPIIYTVNPDDNSIPFRISENGERFWFLGDGEYLEQRLWKNVTWYRVAVVEDGVPEAICYSDWTKPDPKSDVTEIPCTLSKGKLRDHLSKPLVGMLDYWVGDVDGDENKKPANDAIRTGEVDRIYYLIPR